MLNIDTNVISLGGLVLKICGQFDLKGTMFKNGGC